MIDGKGRWPGNVYVERLWHSLSRKKSTGMHTRRWAEDEKRIADYLRYFNEECRQQGLDNRTPDDVFYKRKPLPKAA